MAEMAGQEIETDRKSIDDGLTFVQLWLRKIERAKKDEENWRKAAQEAINIYEADDSVDIAFNILNSNVETLIPAVYNSSPVPDVRRRYGDADPIAKQVVDVSERAISYSIDQYDIDQVMISVIRDAIVPGRGVPRIKYEAGIADGKVTRQEITTEHVKWDKFIRGPARNWRSMPWIAFEHDLTREELIKLNPKLGAMVEFSSDGEDVNGKKTSTEENGLFRTSKTYEVWDRSSKRVFFLVECYKEAPLHMVDDPLGLPEFFPCPRPLQLMNRPSGLVPICPYKVIKPLINELDKVTKRITRLVSQLKVRGLYLSDLKSDFERLRDCEDGNFEGADNATQFSAQGGLDKAIWVWPIEPIVAALNQLYLQRDQIKQTIYEVTGISDIVRGASDAGETATAQQIKTQWGSLRIQDIQREVARMARDLFRFKVAIMAGKFSDENLMSMTSLPQTQEQQEMWPQVLELFRSGQRSFRIDIETDSTIRADMTRNQQQMNEFMAGTGQFATAMAGLVQGVPQAAQFAIPVMVEIYTAFARKFKLGKQAEDALDSLSSQAQQAAEQPQEEQPSPEAQKAEMEMAMMKQKAEMDAAALQAKLQAEAQKMQLQAQHEERMMALKEREAQMDLQMKQIELQLKQQEMQMTMEAKRAELAMKQEGQRQQFALDQEARAADLDLMHETNDVKRQGMADKAKFDKQRMAQQAKKPNGGEARA